MKPTISFFLVLCIFIIVSGAIVKANGQVIIEFFYWPSTHDYLKCPECLREAYEEFLSKNWTLDTIQNSYKNQVLIERIECLSELGQEKLRFYKITKPNSIVIRSKEGNFTIIEGTFNETYIREVIDAYLMGASPPSSPASPPPPLITTLVIAFTFGFFETFSPCLIILLAFVLSYTMGENSQFKKRFMQVITFAAGFIFATILVFSVIAVGLVVLSLMFGIHRVLTIVVSIFAIIFGLNLLGFNVINVFKLKVETKPLIKNLTRKYVSSYVGLVALGFLFYFLDPCLAPVFVAMMSTLSSDVLIKFLPLITFVFCLGVIIPFIGIGILAVSISKLARGVYRHGSKIRAISGLILIVYALYLIISTSFF